MAMNQIPTLVLGIGGIGCRIAADISEMLSDEDAKHVSCIGIDTNVNDLQQLDGCRMKLIQTSDDRLIKEFLELHPEYKTWFPENQFLRNRGMQNGAGQIRTISRMAGLATEESGQFDTIKQEIQRIREQTPDAIPHTSVTVMIVGSITGGTGAGLFIQMPYYLRRLLRDEAGLDTVVIRGMFMGPDLTEDVQPSPINKEAVKVNGYTCLKELNAFYLMQQESDKYPIELENYDPDTDGTNIPYDYLYLMEKSNEKATIGLKSLDSVAHQMASIVFTLMFSPVQANALSVEDNFVLHQMHAGGMARYSGAGMCRLVYHREAAEKYLTYCTVRDLVKAQWLYIDDLCHAQQKEHEAKKREDRSHAIPSYGEQFVTLFRDNAQSGRQLSFLAGEAFPKMKDGAGTSATNASSLADSIIACFKNSISSLIDKNEELEQQKRAVSVDDKKLNGDITAIANHFSAVYSAADALTAMVQTIFLHNRFTIANRMVPTTRELLLSAKKEPDCLYHWLSSVHPVTARFVCYELINKLKALIAEKQTTANDLEVLRHLNNTDFDSKLDNTQKATEVLIAIRNHTHGGEKDRIIKRITSSLTGFRSDIGVVSAKMKKAVSKQVSNCDDYLLAALTVSNAEVLLERVTMLAKDYELFFDSIRSHIKANETQIKDMERGLAEKDIGEDPVYSSIAAMKEMYREYCAKRSDMLSPNTMEAVFLGLYEFLVQDIEAAHETLSQAQQRKRNADKQQRMRKEFRNTVVSSMETDVTENASDILNLTITEALIREMELTKGIRESDFEGEGYEDDAYQKECVKYIRERIEGAFNMSCPMISAKREKPEMDTTSAYLAMSPLCAMTDNAGNPDAAKTQQSYAPVAGPSTGKSTVTVLLDEEFSDAEIICLRAEYCFLIEDLNKYGPDSPNATAYHERICNLRTMTVGDVTEKDVIIIVPPHLNKNWHEEAFIPALTLKERIQAGKERRCAFYYGLGLGLFRKAVDDDSDDDVLVWHYGSEPIRNCGTVIDPGYTDLFDSIGYNGVMKQDILQKAGEAKAALKRGLRGWDDEDELIAGVLASPWVRGLCDGDGNIADTLLKMYAMMEQTDWEPLVRSLGDVLWDYTEELVSEKSRLVNHLTRAVVREIVRTCSVGLVVSEDGTIVQGEGSRRGRGKFAELLNEILDADYKDREDDRK